MLLLRVAAGYLPPWEYYQNNWGWGCAESGWGCAHEPLINSHDEIIMLILEVPLQNHVIDLIFKAAMLTSGIDGTLCQVFGLGNSGGCSSRCSAEPAEAQKPRCFYLSGMLFKTNEAHTLLPLPLLSVSFSLPANLSFFLTLMPK